MSTDVAEPIRLPSRLVRPMGTAMEAMRRFRCRLSSREPVRLRRRRVRKKRVTAENTSQRIMPSTMRPTVRSGLWGRKRASRPSTAPVRMNCSHSSTAAGGRILPVP